MNYMNPFMNRMNVDITPEGLPPINQDQNEYLCILANNCKDYLALQSSLNKGETPEEDLMDQYYELCTHPSEEVQKHFCGSYKNIEMTLVQGAEGILKNWHPDLPMSKNLRETSLLNRSIRKSSRYTFVKKGELD